MSETVQIVVASGKRPEIKLPEGYQVIHVGASLPGEQKNMVWDDCLSDDVGSSISNKNREYCELTAQYWQWKNSNAEIKGLCHYRRYFSHFDSVSFQHQFLLTNERAVTYMVTAEEIRNWLADCDCILPIPYPPAPRTGEEDLEHYIGSSMFENLRRVVKSAAPAYLKDFDALMSAHHLPYCNMMIARSEIYDAYCDWLFALLERFEKALEYHPGDPKLRRVFGYAAEPLLGTWVRKQKLRVRFTNLIQIENETQFPTVQKKIERAYVHVYQDVVSKRFFDTYCNYMRHRYPKIYQDYLEVKTITEQGHL